MNLDDNTAPRWAVALFGLALLLVAVFFIYSLFRLWPAASDLNHADTASAVILLGVNFQVDLEQRLLLIVVASAAIGGFAHAATSFGSYVGNRQLATSWIWWYVLRLPIGMTLALVVYALLRAGLLSVQAMQGTLGGPDVFRISAISALVGMFSKQATDKLQELFDTLFRTRPGSGDAQRGDKLERDGPAISSVTPVRDASGNVTCLTVVGTSFAQGCSVKVDGRQMTAALTDPNTLSVSIASGSPLSSGAHTAVVTNPPPGGDSDPYSFTT